MIDDKMAYKMAIMSTLSMPSRRKPLSQRTNTIPGAWFTYALYWRFIAYFSRTTIDQGIIFSIRAAQNLNSGILPTGSKAGLVNWLAAASP